MGWQCGGGQEWQRRGGDIQGAEGLHDEMYGGVDGTVTVTLFYHPLDYKVDSAVSLICILARQKRHEPLAILGIM